MVREVRGTMTGPEMERLTTTDAARRLGVSPSTVRRRIAAGRLRAERQDRPQGVRYLVLWDPPVASRDGELDSLYSDTDDEVLPEPERVAWFWWLLIPAVVALGMTLGRWFS
ncbi:MAG: helix-turn-helix domain-containing protein [Actinomycetes bacterium]